MVQVLLNYSYNQETGVFIGQHGKPITNKNAAGYLVVWVNKKLLRVHRIIWYMMTGQWPSKQIDHINGNRSDNRWCNLREVTHTENQQNQKKPSKNNKSGYLGVSWCTQKLKWRANLYINSKQTHLGFFDDPKEAHECYLTAKKTHHKGYVCQ